MSRVINPNAPGKERNRLKRGIALALREMMKEPEPNNRVRDMAAFIVLALELVLPLPLKHSFTLKTLY